jgi:hypothetical protein
MAKETPTEPVETEAEATWKRRAHVAQRTVERTMHKQQ